MHIKLPRAVMFLIPCQNEREIFTRKKENNFNQLHDETDYCIS